MINSYPLAEGSHRFLSRQKSRPPRILFYSPDSFGLGHIRRTLSIAGALNEQWPAAAMLALTGSLATHAYELPDNFDYIKLPAITKGEHGAYTSDRLPISFGDSWSLRERLIMETTETFSPDLILVDHAPMGLRGELVRALERVRLEHSSVRIVLGMRDIVDEPHKVRASWRNEGVYDLLDRVYDRILVYGSRNVFDPVLEYGLSPKIAAKTTFCGYIRKHECLTRPSAIRARLGAEELPLVVVTVGGGGDGVPVIDAYLESLRSSPPPDHISCIITGPLMASDEQERLKAEAREIPNVRLLPFATDLTSYVNAADLVVAMGGYNTVTEIVALGKRAIIIPRVQPRQEQLIRAVRFAELGLITYIRPDEVGPTSFRSALRDALASSPPRQHLDFSGLSRACSALGTELDSRPAMIGMERCR